MRTTFLTALVLAPPAGCTTQLGDGGGGPIVVDASVVDATPSPDALPPGRRDGERCLVTPEDPSGDCAPGFACTVVGGGVSQCRQTCPDLNFACTGYTGPGYSLCALAYNNDQGERIGNLCMVVCGDENMTLRGCDDGKCNGMCPGDWTCQDDPINFGIDTCQ